MSQESLYQVGAASVDITPSLDKPVFMAGFAPNRKAQQVLHPLTAGILYIKDQVGGEVCLVTLDLIGFFKPNVDAIREKVKGVIAPERVWVCSTHSHSGPDTMGLWGKAFAGFPTKSGVDAGYMEMLAEKVAEGISQAKSKAEPATLASVTFDTPSDWVRNDRKGGGAYRRTVALVARAGDRIPAVLVNFAAHPETLWDKNHQLSPDYPAPFRQELTALGAEQALFFSGPLGAMLTPNVDPKGDFAKRLEYVQYLGKSLARLTMERIREAKPLTGPLVCTHKPFLVANLNWRFNFARKLGVFGREIPNGFIETEMNQLAIGHFRLTSIPGEASPEVGDMIYDALCDGDRMMFCLGCDELGYIIPSNFWINKEYKYETTMSLGSHMAHLVVSHVYEQRLALDRQRKHR